MRTARGGNVHVGLLWLRWTALRSDQDDEHEKDTAMNHNDDQETKMSTPTGGETRLARQGGLSYLHIPAVDVQQSASFYEQIFGWKIRGRDTDYPGFDDGTGHVSGAWVTDLAIALKPGLLPYIYVDHIDDILKQVEAQGGEV